MQSRFGTGGNQIKERRKQLEEHAKVDVTQDVFTLLTSIDHFTCTSPDQTSEIRQTGPAVIVRCILGYMCFQCQTHLSA